MTIHLEQSGNINTIQTGTTASNSSADLRINNIGSSTNYMTITTAGNIGIGTTSPDSILTIGATSANVPYNINIQNSSGNMQLAIAAGTGQYSVGASAGDAVLRSLDKKLHLVSGSANLGICIGTSGNVGIGTTAPSLKLHVLETSNNDTAIIESSASFGSVLQVKAIGTNGRNFKIQSTASGDGLNPSGAFVIDDATAQERRIVLQSNGNVGIGTNSPTQKLDVNGNINFTGSLYQNGIVFSGSSQWGNGASSSIYYNSGNVGVGTSTPSTKLHVRTTSNNFVRIETDSNLAGEVSGIEFGIPVFASSTRSKITSTTFAADGSDLKFHTVSGTTAGSVRMTIGTSGNVGIGTTSPSSRIHVVGSGAGTNGSMMITGADSFGHSLYIGSAAEEKRLVFNNNGTVGNIFAYNYGSSASQNLALQGFGGNVGIGTTNPKCLLHISSPALSNDIPTTGTGNSTKFSFMESYDGTNGFGLIGGVTANTGLAWLQSKYNNTTGTLPMSLQPLGGNLLVGTSAHTFFTGNRLTVRSDSSDAQNAQILIQGSTDARKTMHIGYDTTNNYAFIDSLNHEVAWTNTIFCRNGGRVGIATTNPINGRLSFGLNALNQTIALYDGNNNFWGMGANGTLQFHAGTTNGATGQMHLTDTGRLGIGTSSPGHRLDILDSASTTSYPILIRALAPNLSNPYNVTILLGRSSSCYDSSQISHDNYFGAGDTRNFGSLSYTCYGTVAMWNGQGRFGIGTVTPGYRLDVQGGDINASGSVRSNGSALTSDMRVKENIVDADTSVNLQHILALKVRHYDYTPNFLEHTGRQDESNYGFIAQEVKEIIPNAVDILPNNLMRAVVEEIPEMNEDGTPKIDEDGNPVLRINRRNEIIEEISDFHFLKKELIFTEAVGAIQELYKLYSDLKQEFEDYKTTHP